MFKGLTAIALTALLGMGSPAAAAEEVVIAVAGPMTGQFAAFGEQMRRGAELAVADINARGGVLGRPIRLEIADDACDPKQAVAVANVLVNKGVSFVAGHFCSSSSIPASAVYGEANVVMISPASTNPALTDEAAGRGWTGVLRVCGRDDAQGAVAGPFLAERFGDRKIAIIHDKSAYGKGLAEETRKALNAAGVKEAMVDSVTQGEKDFSSLIIKMKQADIGVIYFGGYHTEAGLLIRQARDQGLEAQLVTGDALTTDEFWKITGPAGEGVIFTFAPHPRDNPNAADVVARLKAQGIDPEAYVLYTYAAIQVWSDAVAKAGSLNAEAVGKALRDGTYETVIGPLAFDAKGDIVDPTFLFYQWKDGQYAELKS